MPKASVKIYDENDKLVTEVPYGQNGLTGIDVNGVRQQVYKDIDKDGNTVYVAAESFKDPFLKIGQDIDREISIQAPKVAIDGNKITVSAPQEILSSPIVAQVKQELQSLKGADLSSPETRRAIEALNEEVQNSVKDSMLQASTGWTRDQYNDYEYARQSVRTTNPMKSGNKIKGRDKDGNIVMKTPQEWIDYYRKFYNTDERTAAYRKSYLSTDPYERTMALVMGQGEETPVYGFDTAERLGQGWKAFVNQMGKFPEGTFRLLAEDNATRRAEAIAKNNAIPAESMLSFDITTEEQFNDRKKELQGKSWDELSDDDKAFLVLLGSSREGRLEKEADTSEAMENYRGKRTNRFAWETNEQDYKRAERKAARQIGAEDLNDAVSSDSEKSKGAIQRILSDSSLEDYHTVRNNYDTWQRYEQWTEQGERELAQTADWSGSEQWWGNLAGTIGRFLWEDAVARAATGGLVSMNAISDKIGAGIVSSLARHGISPTSNFGRNLLQFSANLIGTIPEDIVQTAVDNVVTYNVEENQNLLNPEEMSANLRNNLIFMSLFNAARAGISSLRRAKMARELAKKAGLSQGINIDGIASDADDLARAVKNGQQIKVDNEVVSIVGDDGKEIKLNNISPEQAEMVQPSLFDIYNPDLDKTTLKPGDKIEFETTYGGRQRWFDGEIIEENGKLRIRGSDYEDIDLDANEVNRVRRPIGEAEFESEPTTKVSVEVDTPDGRVLAEAPDYRPRNFDEAIKLKVEPTAPAVLHGQNVKLNTVMDSFQNEFLPDFRNRFGDVDTSDFDWVFHNSRNGLTPEQIIGTVNPETNRVVTKEMIDAMEWWADSPYTKDLRMASRDALGMEGDFNILGYLPHTTYDPTNMSFEEALTGRLWQQYTGASMTDEVGNYKGFGGDLQSRYRTFASNMLWDSMNNEVAAAKLMEEAQMDGVDLSPEQAVKAVEGEKEIRQKVNDAPSSKELTKALSSDSDDIDWNKIDDNIKKQAETSGLGKAIHDNYQDVYYGANSSAVGKQGNAVVNSFDTLGNRMRNTTIGNGMSMYDWGGADLVYAPKNAAELVTRYMNEGGDFRDMLIEYIENHSHRSPQYAESVADKWMAKLGEIPGELNKGKVIYSLGNSMKWEAMTRLKKWLTMANYDQFNDSTKKMIDRFLFDHMQMDAIKNNPTIGQKLTKALDTMTSLRYRALFYGNIKNALLQTSELNRYFSSFKWGDVAQMAKRLATDESFRARVDTYVDAVAPSTSYLDAELYGKFSNVADSMEVEENGVKFKDLGKKTKETADAIGLGPIEAAESFKNRMMVAGLVQEADRLGLTGDEALRHIRRRFERVGLAADEMGRIGMSSNPLAKTMLFLQNFQIRELGMHLYNIMDEWKLGNSVPKKVLNATKYLTKVFGAKLATTLILARLGYSASQTMGLDPFGLLDNYTGMDEDDMEWVDKQITGGVLTPFFSGGMTSLLADMYFMARKAYEASSQQTVSDEAEQRLEPSWGLALPELTFDQAMDGARNFVPGNVFMNRINQMNEMMDTGWATSASGNKMYTAPEDALNTLLGYLFGRSATQNAQQYNQTYGDNLLQTLGRINPFREYGEFDPIDTKNYSDWFKGDENDLQQFNKGKYYFQNRRDQILDAYEDAISKSYASDDEIAEAKNNLNVRLEELYNQLERFVAAYEKKNGTIDPAMTKQIVSLLNTGRKVLEDTPEEAEQRRNENYSKALERYSQLGISPVGTYTGPTTAAPDAEVKYQGSPQYRTAISGRYSLNSEAVAVLKEADRVLADERKALKDAINSAYDNNDWDALADIQNQYLEKFDNTVAPILATYGSGVLSSTDVVNQLKDMLSTGTTSRSGDLIPSSQYRKDKSGRYRSMPLETVDVKKWAQQRYSSDIYKNPTVRSYSTAEEDINEIKRLSSQGKMGRARARALELKVRVDNQKKALSKNDYQWLLNFLNNGGK